MGSTLGAAIFYAEEKGWPVVPVWPADTIAGEPVCRCGNKACRSIGKHPVNKIKGKPVAPRGVLEATTNRRVLSHWWSLIPDANIGVRGDKFFALDVDDPDALFELTSQYGELPDTVESHSGSGGKHILFKQPAGLILGNEEGNLPHGINVRGNRGYIIVAPSKNANGEYVWELSSHPRDVELAEAPGWLIEIIGKPSEAEKIGEIECADSIPDIEKLDIHSSMKSLITTAPVDGEDRSSTDQKVIVALLSTGCEPAEVKAIFSNHPIGTEGKYAERGDEYLDRSIARAISYIGPVSKKSTAESLIVPGKAVPEHEARLEKQALDTAYLQGWNAALKSNMAAAGELWPDRLSVTDASIAYYGLGMRTDYPVGEGEYAALVVPYANDGRVGNIGYELYSQPEGTPATVWESESATHVFDTEVDGGQLSGRVLVTEDWDTAMHTYLHHGHQFQWLAVLGQPQVPGCMTEEAKRACLQALASLLADSEQVLLAWPQARRKDAVLLADMIEEGDGRVYWLTLPGTMSQMYKQFGMEARHLNRYLQQAVPVV